MPVQEYALRYAALFGVAFAVCLLLEPLVILGARACGVTDTPNWRKVHTRPMARMGGLAFLPALLAAFILALWYWPVLWQEKYYGVALAALILVCTGLWDDACGMRPIVKLFFQFAAGACLWVFQYRFDVVSLPFTETVLDIGRFDFIVIVVGTALVINAINMIDGLDGLAAGSTFIMCLFLFISKMTQGGWDGGLVLAAGMGLTLAFLCFNLHPARVFMGDTGSMVLGLLLASELFDASSRGVAVTTLLIPLSTLAVPLVDLFRTVFSRARRARHLFAADKSHLHHHLLELGLTQRGVVVFIYAMNVYVGVMAMLYYHVEPAYRAALLISTGLFLFLTFYLIGTHFRAGATRPGDPRASDE